VIKRVLISAIWSIGLMTAFWGSAALAAQPGSNDIIVQTLPGPTVGQQLTHRTTSSWSWYLTRASGLIAAAALIVLLLSGIGQITGDTFRFLEPLTAWASHRALGLTFIIAVLVHMFTLLFDHFVPFSLWQILLPWLSSYKPITVYGLHLGSLYVALGVVAFYLTLAIVLTSIFWIDKKPYVWKLIHLVSYIVIAMVFIHALYLGTDFAHGIWRWLWIIAVAAVGMASLYRLWRAKTI
jgi:sulfoxide reductase heme-binding subunit YedZ